MNKYAEIKNATSAQISLAWMLHKYSNVVPIPSSKNQDRILENLSADKVVFTEEELSKYTIYGHRGHVEEDPSKGFLRTKSLR